MAPSLKVSREQLGFILSLLVVAAMAFVAAVGFRSVLNGWSFAVAGGLAAGGATLIVALAARFRLVLGESVAASAAGFVILGAIAVGGWPLPGSFVDFARGITNGWADILSSSPPADITPEFRALPFAIAWIGAAFGGELIRHTRRFGLPAIGPIGVWALSLLFTTEDRMLAIGQGVAMLAGTLLLVTLATRLRRPPDDGETAPLPTRARRVASGLAIGVFIGAVVVSPVLGPRMPLADANERFDLRRYQEPPFDPLAVPSPLTQIKSQLQDEQKDDVLFTVTAPTEVDRFPLATLTDYNGVVWTVANEDENPAAEFIPVDTVLPELTDEPPPDGSDEVTMTVEIVDLRGVWLPTAGTPTNLRYAGERDPDAVDDDDFEREVSLETRMNRTTGTLALPSGIHGGLTYDVRSTPPTIPDASVLADAIATPIGDSADYDLMPPVVWNMAGDFTEQAETPWEQVQAIADGLTETGYYESDDEQPPGHSWQRFGQMFDESNPLVGYEEQYAGVAGTMARRADLPVRVVVGYHIQEHHDMDPPAERWDDGTLEVTANDIDAWLEIRVDGYGWLPVDVTPDRDQELDDQEIGVNETEVVTPDDPELPPEPPDQDPPTQIEEDQEEVIVDLDASRSVGQRLETWAMALAVGAGGPLMLLLLVAALIVAWKALRARRRRHAAAPERRIGGAWAETVDRCYDAGVTPPRKATPNEVITAWAVAGAGAGAVVAAEPELRTLAGSVDRSVYAATGASDEHAEAAWAASDSVVEQLRSGRPLWRRMWMRVKPGSLFLREDGGRG